MTESKIIPGFQGFSEKFVAVVNSPEWELAQNDFNTSFKILTVGNGGNLAVCDHGAIDIARLTDKQAIAPGSGILANSLINDSTHDLWVRIGCLFLFVVYLQVIKSMMIIGVSSSGISRNICSALDLALEKGMKTLLISAQKPQIKGNYNTIVLDVDEYHTSEVLTLSLFYQLIHSAGFTCPPIAQSQDRDVSTDYTRN